MEIFMPCGGGKGWTIRGGPFSWALVLLIPCKETACTAALGFSHLCRMQQRLRVANFGLTDKLVT